MTFVTYELGGNLASGKWQLFLSPPNNTLKGVEAPYLGVGVHRIGVGVDLQGWRHIVWGLALVLRDGGTSYRGGRRFAGVEAHRMGLGVSLRGGGTSYGGGGTSSWGGRRSAGIEAHRMGWASVLRDGGTSSGGGH